MVNLDHVVGCCFRAKVYKIKVHVRDN